MTQQGLALIKITKDVSRGSGGALIIEKSNNKPEETIKRTAKINRSRKLLKFNLGRA